MKALEFIQIKYMFGDEIKTVDLKSNPQVTKLDVTGPGMAEIHYTGGLVEFVVSSQMTAMCKFDKSKIETIDMDIARVS